MKTFRILFGLLFLTAPLWAEEKPDKYEAEISKLQDRLQAAQIAPGGVAFFGSSTMRMWDVKASFPERTIANCGFGGATIPDQLRYTKRLVAPLKPSQIVFYCGGNDLASGAKPDRVVEDFQEWLALLRTDCPTTDVLYLAIRPTPSRAKILEQEREVNRQIHLWCEAHPDEHCTFLDLESTVRAADGTLREDLFLPDKLHLNPAGYEIWTNAVRPYLK